MKGINKPAKIYSHLTNSDILRDWFYLATKNYNHEVAFRIKDKKSEKIDITYSQLEQNVTYLAAGLLSKGYANEKAIIIGKNSYKWMEAYLSTLVSGMVAVPLDAGLKEEEAITSIERANPRIIFCDETKCEMIEKAIIDKGLDAKIVVLETENIEGKLTTEEIIEEAKKDMQFKEAKQLVLEQKIDEEEVKILLFTSGTTSMSKIVQLTNKNLACNIRAVQKVIEITSKDSTLALLPFHHVFGSVGALLFLFSGAKIAFVESIKKFKDNIVEYKPTLLFLVPAVVEMVYNRIYATVKKQGKEKIFNKIKNLTGKLKDHEIDIRRILFKKVIKELGGEIKTIFVGAAAMKKEVIQDYYDLGIDVIQGYGMSETSPVISAESYSKRRPGSVGQAMPCNEVKIYNPDENGVGEIIVKGENVFKGYMNDEEKTKEVLIDGWCHTGDVGYIDDDGFIFLTGRKKDIIVLQNGKKIFPEEIEMVLNDNQFIKDIIVFGEEEGDNLKLVAKIRVEKEELLKELEVSTELEAYNKIWEIIKETNERFPKYKYIKDVYITEEEFEKTTTLKVKRFKEVAKTYDDLKANKTESIKEIIKKLEEIEKEKEKAKEAQKEESE